VGGSSPQGILPPQHCPVLASQVAAAWLESCFRGIGGLTVSIGAPNEPENAADRPLARQPIGTTGERGRRPLLRGRLRESV
jgi:hypothetical protein